MPSDVMVIAQIDEVKGVEQLPVVEPFQYRYTLLVRENTVVSFNFRMRKDGGKPYRLVIGSGESKYIQYFFCPDDIKVYIYRNWKLAGAIRDMSKLFFRAAKVRFQVVGQGTHVQYILKIHL